MEASLATSRDTFRLPRSEGHALFNANTGSVLRLQGADAAELSDGTHWPDDVGSFVARHRIRQVQISFDGLKINHDRRRRYRPAYRPAEGASSFDRAVRLVDRLLQHTRVDIRYNADCGALAPDSAVIGTDGLEYRCGPAGRRGSSGRGARSYPCAGAGAQAAP